MNSAAKVGTGIGIGVVATVAGVVSNTLVGSARVEHDQRAWKSTSSEPLFQAADPYRSAQNESTATAGYLVAGTIAAPFLLGSLAVGVHATAAKVALAGAAAVALSAGIGAGIAYDHADSVVEQQFAVNPPSVDTVTDDLMRSADRNGNGVMDGHIGVYGSPDESSEAPPFAYHHNSDAAKMYESMDLDGDGTIDRTELRSAVATFDEDHDGRLEGGEAEALTSYFQLGES